MKSVLSLFSGIGGLCHHGISAAGLSHKFRVQQFVEISPFSQSQLRHEQPGPFFGMPYQNFAGWLGTSSVFMTVTALFWRNNPINWERSQLNIPFAVYLTNFGFATVMSLTAGFFVPVLLGLLLGVTPAVLLWLKGSSTPGQVPVEPPEISVARLKVTAK